MKQQHPSIGLALSLLAGTALWLSFFSDHLFPLAWVALVPFLAFLWSRPGWRLLLLGHTLMSVVYLGGILYWIPQVLHTYGGLGWLMTAVAFLLMLMLLAMSLLPFSLLTRWLVTRSEGLALVCAPGAWMLTELIRNYWVVNGFPWALVGYSQYPFTWITQIADIGGIYLVSLLVLAVNVSLWGAIRARSPLSLLPVLCVFLVANLYGIYRVHWWSPTTEEPIRVALVQPNLKLFENREYYASQYFEVLPAEYQKVTAEGAEWVIFPEAPNPYFYGEDFYFTAFWQREIGRVGVPLLFNSTTPAGETAGGYYNSAVLLEGEAKESYLYRKTHLVPFGEYIPLADLLGTLFQPLVQEVAGFSAGHDWPTGVVSGSRFGTLICYEAIFPELGRRLVNEGSQLLVNITNDTWYGWSAAAAQHLRIATFRAIETRKPLLRVANSGYSAVVDPTGRIRSQLGLFERGTLVADVAGNGHLPFYSRAGEWINILIVVVTGLLALSGCRRPSPVIRKRRKKKGRR